MPSDKAAAFFGVAGSRRVKLDLGRGCRPREWLCWESNCTALFARKPNRLRKSPVQVVKLDYSKALSSNYQTSIKETR